MNLYVKYCKDCGEAYDYYECPFCRRQREELKEEDIERDKQKTL